MVIEHELQNAVFLGEHGLILKNDYVLAIKQILLWKDWMIQSLFSEYNSIMPKTSNKK